jgi:hypothetical protein
MTTIVTRTGKGSPLTHVEVDTNFTNLNTAKLEAGAIALGSAGTPSISFTGDTNTGIFSPGADQLAISTNGTGRLFVASDGTIGIGQASDNASYRLNVFNPSADFCGVSIGNNVSGGGSVNGLTIGQNQADALFVNRENGPMYFSTNNTERMRLTSAGLLGLGSTLSGNANNRLLVRSESASAITNVLLLNNGAANGNAGQGVRLNLSGISEVNSDIRYAYIEAATQTTGNDHYLAFGTNSASTTPVERARIDSSGRLLVGTSTSRIIEDAVGNGPEGTVQVEGITSSTCLSVITNSNTDANRCGTINLGRSRGAALTSYTVVQNNDKVGALIFSAADGIDIRSRAAQIVCEIDGAPSGDDVPGRLVFSTTADGAASPTERMRITSTGQVRLAGAGITFNGDTAAANELDDYEEGTHTATLTPSTSGSITLNANYQTLTYTKIGRLVSIRGTLIASSSSSPVGYVIVSLPFTPAAVSGIGYAGGSVFVDAATGVNANQFVLMVTTGGARIYLGDSTALQTDSAQAIASAGQVYLEMNYHV